MLSFHVGSSIFKHNIFPTGVYRNIPIFSHSGYSDCAFVSYRSDLPLFSKKIICIRYLAFDCNPCSLTALTFDPFGCQENMEEVERNENEI